MFVRISRTQFVACIMILFLAFAILFASGVSAQSSSSGQLSKAGGVGITRGDFESFYGSLSGGGALTSTIDLERLQVFTSMESRKFGLFLSGSFRLESDLKLRSSDRLINVTIEPNKTGQVRSLKTAGRLVGLMLPADAIGTGRTQTNSIGEPVAKFHSDTIAELFPREAICTGDDPGTIWVTVTPTGGDTIGLIDISISNPDESDCV